MSLKHIIFSILPTRVKVYLFKKIRYNSVCGYGQTFSTYVEQALDTFLSPSERSNNRLKENLINDMLECWVRYKALPYEYFLFDFRNNQSKTIRATFLTDWDRLPTLTKLDKEKEFIDNINNKYNFYCKFQPFFKRRAIMLDKNSSKDEFIKFAVKTKSVFAKLIAGSKGIGAISREIESEKDAEILYRELISKGDWIVEERIQQSQLMAQWCSTCVNTVRLPSFLTKKGFYLLDPFFRTGHEGSIVDNAGQGGVFAVIDPKTGVLITDGVDEAANSYKCHPDSNLPYKGWQIPFWNELLETAERAHRMIPNQKYIGWDFALNNNNEWVIIEANWGQMVGQYATRKGVRKEFYKYLNL